MTIFHVLKHQISAPPILNEIESLPDEVFLNLLSRLDLSRITTSQGLIDFINHYYFDQHHYNRDMIKADHLKRIQNILNQLLYEYDDTPRT